jgi:hypothetical protein
MDSCNAGKYPQENEIIGYFVGVVHDSGCFRKVRSCTGFGHGIFGLRGTIE